jgi:hypothetical protein
MKKVLFVTYGGGHAAMVAPVVRALSAYPDIVSETLALTLGGPYFKRQGLSYKGFKDFLTPADRDAMEWGRRLAEQSHRPATGIEQEEAIAYLGLSYWDLVMREGRAQAARLWVEKQREAFYPLSVMERVIGRSGPDMVVTTNSPRSEQAAIQVANRRGIPTLSMQDLFGVFNWCQPQADYVTVISPLVIENIIRDKGRRAGQEYLVTGNPAFDSAFDHRGPVNVAWRQTHLPSLPANAKALLWVDEGNNVYRPPGESRSVVHIRSDEEITCCLETLARSTRASDGYLLIRPHPSQQRAVYDQWMNEAGHRHVIFAGDLPLYPLLNAVDAVATFTSTVGCEALLMGRPVIQIGYHRGQRNLLLGEWGVARLAETPEQLPEMVRRAFQEGVPREMQLRIDAMFSNERAAPKIAAAIARIISRQTL